MRTITQVAEELKVSRKKIYNEIEKLNINTTKDGKNNYISDEDFELIRSKIAEQSNSAKERAETNEEREQNANGNVSEREYNDLKERISFLEEQLKAKDEQLQTKDYQINGLIQSNFSLTKALPSAETADEAAADVEILKPRKSIFNIFRKK